MPMVEWDESNQIIKVHLLLHWKTQEVLSFLRSHGIPYNPLHDKDILVLDVLPAPEPSGKEKTSEPAAGGGRTKPTKNVVCTYISRL